MIAYRVRDWGRNFENNRTRELKHMVWVPIPTKSDGDGYTELVTGHANGAAHFGCWTALVKVAARCGTRGTLLRAGGEPHTPETVARMSHMPADMMAEAWARFVNIGWLEAYEAPQPGAGLPHLPAAIPQGAAPSRARATVQNPTGQDRTEQPPVAPQPGPAGGQAATGQPGPGTGGCALGGDSGAAESREATDADLRRLIPAYPAFRIACANLVPLGLVAELLAGGRQLASTLAAVLVTGRDCRTRAKLGNPIESPPAWLRTVLGGKIPDADYDAAKRMLRQYGVRRDELAPDEAEAINAVISRLRTVA